MSRSSILVVIMLLAGCAFAQQFQVPLLSKPPVIDGKIDAAEWAVSAGFDGFGNENGLEQRRVQGWVGADENTIYVAIRSQLPASGELNTGNSDGMPLFYRGYDTVGAQVNPTPGLREVDYQLLVNSAGTFRFWPHTRGQIWENPAWEGGWKHAGGMHNGYWEWECAIPINSMTTVVKGRKTTDGIWNINLTRDYRGGYNANQALSCRTFISYFSEGGPHQFTGIPFRFVKSGPVLQYQAESDPFLSNFTGRLKLFNPSATPVALKVSLALKRDAGAEIQEQKTFTLAPGEQNTVALVCPKDEDSKKFSLAVLASSVDNRTIYYSRTTSWQKADGPVNYIGQLPVKPAPIILDYAYYPTKNLLRAAVDLSNLPPNVRLTTLSATVKESVGDKVITSFNFPLDKFTQKKQEIRVTLPPLNGDYQLVLTPEGTNAPAPIVKEFERHVFPWENIKMGLTTKVYPPFKPITIQHKVLSTVLKTHTLNDQGLLDQITAQSAQTGVTRALLARPMKYTAMVNNKTVAVNSSPLHVVLSQENMVKTESKIDAGGVQLLAQNTWDYDGTVRVDLTIQPTAGKRLDKLDLVIPFDGKVVTMVDAYADRRGPVIRYLPKKNGVLWDATIDAYSEYPRTFCPYVFLGSPVRGLCWFAENDKGWSRDTSKPNMELTREGSQVVLRIHLVNKPTASLEPGTLTFGMLAVPIKPRLDQGHGANWWRYRYIKDGYSLLATDIVWGSLGNCGGVYPAGRDLTSWDIMKKARQEGKLTEADMKKGTDSLAKYFAPYGPDQVSVLIAHLRSGMSNAANSKKPIFYYNRSSYQDCEEFQTFKDEWGISNYRSVEKGIGRDEITVVPTPSYIDYALYWYKVAFDRADNQGVYWDNWLFKLTWNTEMTQAYTNSDGSVMPGTGVWELRELSKRTFQMMNDLGKDPITWPHMTGYDLLPMMSFATLQYDWEWKYSWGDVQDRFLREYILLVSNGELSGVWPVTLGDSGKLGQDLWTQRTFAAVKLLHELDGGGQFAGYGTLKENLALAKPILDFIDKPGVVAYRYWDETPQPVKSANPNLPTVVYSLPGQEAIAAVVSYADNDEPVTLKIDAKALGFNGTYTVTNTETGETMKLKNNTVSFPLKRHDIRVLRFVAEGK